MQVAFRCAIQLLAQALTVVASEPQEPQSKNGGDCQKDTSDNCTAQKSDSNPK